MGSFNIFQKIKSTISHIRLSTSETMPPIQTDFSAKIQYTSHETPKVTTQTSEKVEEYRLGTKYVCISTSDDENVCSMCAQFEGKYFLSIDAPKLPLCPLCSCEYEYYAKEDLPSNATISTPRDFVLPADCTPLFYKIQHTAYEDENIQKVIRLCEQGMKKLPEFIAPYISAKFSVPELACRDLLPELYMRLGKWDKAKSTIERCIAANAYYPEDGSREFADLESYRVVATATLSYISENPGCLQRNIYKVLPFEGNQKEQLKHFLRYSLQIKKEKYNNTNKLYIKNDS